MQDKFTVRQIQLLFIQPYFTSYTFTKKKGFVAQIR